MSKGVLFLTGGSGMVGRNVLEHPAAADWTILAPSSGDLDLMDEAAVRAFYEANKPDLVVHAAGQVGGIQANIAHPVAFLDRNVSIGRNVILGAHQAGVRRLINLASTCIYPRNGHNPLREELILTGELEPTNEGYALTKIMALRLCQYIRREDERAQFKTLIPCNLYGRYDKFDPKHSHLVPAVIHKIHEARANGQEEVEIWGDGSARREFMYAADLAHAIFQAANDIEAIPDLMNIGLGHDYSIREYYEAVAQTVGWAGRFTYDTSKPVGMKQKLTDTSRQETWGWQPATSLHDGLKLTYEHYLSGL